MTIFSRAAAQLRIWDTQLPFFSPAFADAANNMDNLDAKWTDIHPMNRQAILGVAGIAGMVAVAGIVGEISANIPLPTPTTRRSAARTTSKTQDDFFIAEDNSIQGIRAAKSAAARIRVNEGLENTPVRTMGDYNISDGSFDVTFFGMGNTGLATNNLLTLHYPAEKIQKTDLSASDATNFKVGTVIDKARIRSQVGPDKYGDLIHLIRQIERKVPTLGQTISMPNNGFTPPQ